MKRIWIKLVLNTVSLFIASVLLSSTTISNNYSLIGAGLILTLLNLVIRPLVLLLSLPINLLSLGLFSILINTWMVMLMDIFSQGIIINGFWGAIATALILSATHHLFLPPN